MVSGRFSGHFVAAAITASMMMPVPPASANDTPGISPVVQAQYKKWADIPAQFHLTGQILDDEDNPIRGVTIFSRDKEGEIELAKSGSGGTFKITEMLSPSTRLVIRHRMFAPRYVDAGTLYIGEGQPVSIEIILYTERFDVTPEGGIYQSGELTLEVPEGAVLKPVTILAAQLPLDYAYNHDGTPEPVRLTSVDLKPHGLTFAKPVTLTMTIAREDMDEITDPISFYYDEDMDRYVRDPLGTVEIREHRAAITLSHFSPHAIADGKRAQSTQHLGRGSDVDGDSVLTPSDALFMLLASGGTQKAGASYSQIVAGSVRKIIGDPNPDGAIAPSSGFDVSGNRYPVSPAMSRTEAKTIAEKFSLGRKWEKTIRAGIDVLADEYEFDCKLLLGRYAFHRAAGWQRVTPGVAEMAVIRKQWDARTPGNDQEMAYGHFVYFNWQGSRDLIVAPALPGKLNLPAKQKLAVTMNEDGLAVYVERSSYIIAKLRGDITGTCPSNIEPDLWASTDKAIKGVRGHEARQGAMKENFYFGIKAKEAHGALPWGTSSRDNVRVYANMKCESEDHQVWNYSVIWEEASNNVKAQSRAQIRTWTTQSLPTARAGSRPVSSVEWLISNPRQRTFSEHITASLFKQTPDGPIPFGFMLHRIGERPCGATRTPALTAPGEPTLSEPDPGRPYGLASHNK